MKVAIHSSFCMVCLGRAIKLLGELFELVILLIYRFFKLRILIAKYYYINLLK